MCLFTYLTSFPLLFCPPQAVQGVYGSKGASVLVLSDKMAGADRMAIPSLLAIGAVHQHLIKTKQRPKAAVFVECGDGREVHDFSTLLGFGADGVCPYLAYEALARMNAEGLIQSRANQVCGGRVCVGGMCLGVSLVLVYSSFSSFLVPSIYLFPTARPLIS